MDVRKLRGLGPRGTARAIYRKFIVRRIEMGFYEGTREATKRVHADGYRTVIRDGSSLSLEELANPHVDQAALDSLQAHPSPACVLVYVDDVVVASNWYLSGTVDVPELQRSVTLPDGTYYSCRTFVHPDQRGRHLVGHMLTAFIESKPDLTSVGGFILDSNTASIRAFTNMGWSRTATYWSSWILGRQRSGESRAATT